MSGNSVLTNNIILKDCLDELNNQLVLVKKVNKQYSSQFANVGAKVGDTINVRKPSRYEVTSGATLNIQDSVDKSITLAIDNQHHVGMAFSNKDRKLSLDDFRARYGKPAMTALANKIDSSFYSTCYKGVYHSVGIPSASALPSTLKGFGQARAKIAKSGASIDNLTAIVDYDVEASLVNGLSGLFQASDSLSSQYKKGSMGMASGMDFYASQNVTKHTIGLLGGTPLMNGTTAAGATTLVTNGWTNSTGALKAGDVISIAAVNEVNPQTRQSTGALAQFVVAADVTADGSGNMTITVDRAIYASGQYQNVDALPLTSAAITIFGHASSYASVVAPQNLVFDPNFAALVFVDPAEVDGSIVMKDEETGISMRMWKQGDITNDREITRFDVLWGGKVIYAEYGCRVVGQPA